MAHEIIRGQDQKAWINAHEFWSQYNSKDSDNTSAKHKRLLNILHRQYGDTIEKTIGELEINNPPPTIKY
jgi:hypothetical protein